MRRSHFRRKNPGQSIPLIALVLVVLFGMVGLAVDVGNTYAQQRATVRAANSASLAGMNEVIRRNNDAGVAKVINESFASNGIKIAANPANPAPGERVVRARYFGADGNAISDCLIGNCGAVPNGASYIQIQVEGTVDTYFARVVGTNSLPVNTVSYAARCTPIAGVYPIAVQNSDLGPNGFVRPTGNLTDAQVKEIWGKYADELFVTPRDWRRVTLKPNGGESGTFSFVRWKQAGDGDAGALAQSLSGDGNVENGYQERPDWPRPDLTPIKNYPLGPNQMTIGDWVYGNAYAGWSNGDAVMNALRDHMQNRTVMVLPIVDKPAGGGSDTAFQIVRLGTFYINSQKQGVSSGGVPSLDLVYLGDANETACLRTAVERSDKLGLVGSVSVLPRLGKSESTKQPIAYQMVLDVSGSMSWSFEGYGRLNGQNYQCENEANIQRPGMNLPYTDKCTGGPNSTWPEANERRIKIAKDSIERFIVRMEPTDTMRIVSFSTAGIGSSTQWTSDKAVLSAWLRTAGSYQNDPYRTQGGTPGPDALEEVSRIAAASNMPTTAPNGLEYERVVIYVTDGVANIFRRNGSGIGVQNSNPLKCQNRGWSANRIINTAFCQLGVENGVPLPITDMQIISADLTRRETIDSVYVLAMGALMRNQDGGLIDVASAPEKFFRASNPGDVERMLTAIQGEIKNEPCSATNGAPIVEIPSSSHSGFSGLAAPDHVGFVYINNESGTSVLQAPLKIMQNQGDSAFSNRMFFQLPAEQGLPPGTYFLKAYVGYKAPNDVARQYDWIYDKDGIVAGDTIRIEVSSSKSLGDRMLIEPFTLHLKPNIDVCQ
jgi:hypothetical protein